MEKREVKVVHSGTFLGLHILQLISINHLDHNARGGTATVADRRAAILALLELMQQGYHNP